MLLVRDRLRLSRIPPDRDDALGQPDRAQLAEHGGACVLLELGVILVHADDERRVRRRKGRAERESEQGGGAERMRAIRVIDRRPMVAEASDDVASAALPSSYRGLSTIRAMRRLLLPLLLLSLIFAGEAGAAEVVLPDNEGRSIRFDLHVEGVDPEWYAALLRAAPHRDEISTVRVDIVSGDELRSTCAAAMQPAATHAT